MVTQASHLLIYIRNIHFLGTQPHCSLPRLPILLGESEEWEFILCLNHTSLEHVLFHTILALWFSISEPKFWYMYPFSSHYLLTRPFVSTLEWRSKHILSSITFHGGGEGHHNYPCSGTTGYKSVTVSNGTCSYKPTCSKTKKLLVTLHFILLSLLLTLLHTPFWKDGPSGNVFFLPQLSTSMKLIKWCHASFYLIWK